MKAVDPKAYIACVLSIRSRERVARAYAAGDIPGELASNLDGLPNYSQKFVELTNRVPQSKLPKDAKKEKRKKILKFPREIPEEYIVVTQGADYSDPDANKKQWIKEYNVGRRNRADKSL